jgi:hypothetical protein
LKEIIIKIGKMPKCFTCGAELIWQNDFDTEDVGQEDSEFLIVSMYQCRSKDCGAWYEVYHGKKEEDKSIN